jgi:ACT domain-containing protein
MNNPIEQLVAVLEKELEVHRALIAAAREMNDAVKTGAIDKIQAAAHRYDDCITNIADMEEKRLDLSDAICRGTLGNLPHASLLRVINTVPVEWKKTIAGLREKLKTEINDLSKINYANQVLLTESLHSIQKTFDLITAARASRLGGYRKQGKKAEPGSTMRIINTIA